MNNGQNTNGGEFLPVMEQFYSIQGEGLNTGKAAFFLRIGGCDVGCSFCDVKESWNPDIFPPVHVDEIVKNIQYEKADAVVITGGEPMLYNLDILCERLKNAGIEIFLETSGSEPYSGDFDWISLSPKAGTSVHECWYDKADEIKVIIEKEADFAYAESLSEKVHDNCTMLLQPEWSVVQTILPLIIVYIKQNPEWRLSLQTHKYINIP
ncbi:MAG: 7-carboxy-7-deazaguanine synthase QueE [Marinilabiliales bacterium]|nr:MAG: 7-carboxy-7-deazaguanine synthase QueE [Marinilabiliales bacterium]